LKASTIVCKILITLGVIVISLTTWPSVYAEKLIGLAAKPNVWLEAPKEYWDDVYISPQILQRRAIEDIRILCDPQMQGRRAGTAGETKAMVYLEEQLKALHLLAMGEDNNYLQLFPIPTMRATTINGRVLFRPDINDSFLNPAANILACIPGRDPGQTVIISAHYDHLGVYQGKLYPGANDNASGVSCVLEVVRRLTADSLAGKSPIPNIVVAFWGAEEMGYLGSSYFVSQLTIPLASIKAVINMDSVANGQKEDFIFWSKENDFLVETIQKIVSNLGGRIEKNNGQGHASDELPFVKADIPAVTLLSKQWLNKNHTPADDLTQINEEKLELATDILYALVQEIAY